MTTTNIEVVRAIYDALATRDVDALLARIDAECVFTQDPRLP